ncbi:head decoration protein [Paracidovorax wautersii]|uniref:Bacteriophage lambda head decoration protein D n=1 Tax=Paracidovorax wautersii TaxID=1177982 RepID=A0A1I2E8U4_9BURK|nr:head decoration protein [Paracidovorax wautersii]SFE88690.1 Bacteriophage lambda head decoration protein D [Paracidovorax wautersii]
MTVFTEGRHAAEHIASEANGTRSREVITILAGQKLEAGTVLARIGTGANAGKYTALNPASAADPADGTKVAAAVLFAPVDATTGDRPGVVNVRDTEVKKRALGWPQGANANQKAAALAELAALGIVAR